ncbi:MAG TPA: tetratricopeptide repeat protein [Streptosporangiaceae bacterium]|nr:tetratricopeptide repeat protein [Streptosporangiaceae bacterium]
MNQPRNFSLHGAVDLGARQAAAQRRQRAAEQGSAANGQQAAQPELIIDVTDESFNTEVVARSRTVPVVLDLWADWCGPCKQLGPILERLATEADGAFVLARIDVDANPQLSAALQVQSIPMVVAVVGGQVVDGFLGAMPEAQVRQWLSQVLQVADQLGLGSAGAAAGSSAGAGAVPGGMLDPDGFADAGANAVFAEARQAMEQGDLDAAAAAFEKILAANPADPIAAMGLGQVSLIRRVEGYDQAAVRRDAASRPGDALAQSRLADLELASGEIETAFDRLLATVSRTSGEERDQARKHLISLFEILPAKDPRVTKARARLSSLLF